MTLDHLTAAVESRRVSLGMSKAELARQSGMTVANVADWLNGRSTIRVETLAVVAKVLGLHLMADARRVRRKKVNE